MADIIINIEGQATAASNAVDSLIVKLKELSATLGEISRKSRFAFKPIIKMDGNALDAFSDRLSEFEQSLEGVSRNLSVNVKSVTRTVSSAGNSARRSSGLFDMFGKSIGRSTGFFGKLLKSIGRIAFYRVLRTAIKAVAQAFSEGLKNAYQFSKRTGGLLAPALDKVSSAAGRMKNQLGAALGGVLTAIAPILIRIINLVTRAANAITQLFAILNGSGVYKRATEQMTEWGDAASGAGGKIKGLLAAWDELNVIGQESGGGGGGSSDYNDGMFEWAEVESDWAKLFSEGDFFKIGERLNEGLGNISKKLSDWFDELQNQHYGKKIAEFLNGIFSDPQSFYDAGRTLANGVNTAIGFAFDFFSTINPIDAADSIAAFLNGEVENIDWKKLGKTIGLGVADALEFVGELLLKFDWYAFFDGTLEVVRSALFELLSNPGKLLAGLIRIVGGILFSLFQFIVAVIKNQFYALFLFVDAVISLFDPDWTPVTQKLDEFMAEAKESWDGWVDDAASGVETFFDAYMQGVSNIEESSNRFNEANKRVSESINESGNAIDAWRKKIESIPTTVTTTVNVRYSSVGGPGGGSSGNNMVNLDAYADGGYPETGQLFLSRESGPEMVGTIGNRTAVANNDQIVSGIESGVYRAMMAANSTNSGGTQTIRIINEIDGDVVGEKVIQYHNNRVM